MFDFLLFPHTVSTEWILGTSLIELCNIVNTVKIKVLSNEDYSNCVSPAVFYAIVRLTDFSSDPFDILSSEVG